MGEQGPRVLLLCAGVRGRRAGSCRRRRGGMPMFAPVHCGRRTMQQAGPCDGQGPYGPVSPRGRELSGPCPTAGRIPPRRSRRPAVVPASPRDRPPRARRIGARTGSSHPDHRDHADAEPLPEKQPSPEPNLPPESRPGEPPSPHHRSRSTVKGPRPRHMCGTSSSCHRPRSADHLSPQLSAVTMVTRGPAGPVAGRTPVLAPPTILTSSLGTGSMETRLALSLGAATGCLLAGRLPASRPSPAVPVGRDSRIRPQGHGPGGRAPIDWACAPHPRSRPERERPWAGPGVVARRGIRVHGNG